MRGIKYYFVDMRRWRLTWTTLQCGWRALELELAVFQVLSAFDPATGRYTVDYGHEKEEVDLDDPAVRMEGPGA